MGTELTQAEWESITAHVLDAQATGDTIYASSATQLRRLAIGATDTVLRVSGGIPAWSATLAGLTLTAPDINGGTVDSLTSLSIRSTGAAFDMLFATGVVFTANRTLTITIPDAATALTLTGDLIRSGAHSLTLTTSAATDVTLPTTGTLATLAGSEELTNKTLNAAVGKGTWTASGTWTLPAFTLGGTISGGAQIINNVSTLLLSTSTAYGRINAQFEIAKGASNAVFNLLGFNDADTLTAIEIGKSRGSLGNFVTVSSGDTLGRIGFLGSDGTDWQFSSQIKALVTGTVGADRIPGLLEFYLFSDAAPSLDIMVMRMSATTISIASAITLAGLGTGANGIKLKNLKNAAATALSGTQLDVEIDIGGTPYYFTVYPTKA